MLNTKINTLLDTLFKRCIVTILNFSFPVQKTASSQFLVKTIMRSLGLKEIRLLIKALDFPEVWIILPIKVSKKLI